MRNIYTWKDVEELTAIKSDIIIWELRYSFITAATGGDRSIKYLLLKVSRDIKAKPPLKEVEVLMPQFQLLNFFKSPSLRYGSLLLTQCI